MRATASNPTEDHYERGALASDDDPTSSSGSSSSESESEEEYSEEEEDQELHGDHDTTIPALAPAPSMPHIAGRPKPNIHSMEGGSDLLSRLGQDMVLDSVNDDGKDYIEMNLGLGVLEEKRGENDDSSSADEGDDEGPDGDSQMSKDKGDSDLLGQLMGGITSKSTDKPSIEEMAD
ncbi:uncharacterized protein N7458_006578 [Penicillium daleae]|uniref:Uncharacterized protein n=1 Tax=Penicillium daleae TaxID=63821 RepID=A0AAD6G268_9EURO|nr:uncharacterized protein N7458_006578 [Penicillium daleae]KAJ5450129.1 hypothetical protein N7458_006578 [Penicillium daleae]